LTTEYQPVQNLDTISEVALSWSRQDIEQRIGFSGGQFTRVNNFLAVLLGVLLTAAFYGLLLPFRGTVFAGMFITKEGYLIPACICFFSCWSLAILFIKSRKLAFQRRSLAHLVVPKDHDFVLSAANVEVVTEKIYSIVDDPKHFVLFNRIVVALSNLRNLGRVPDVAEILRSRADHDESVMETSYAVVAGFVWAIPVLGFIGTVLGLSQAIGGFGTVLRTTEDIGQIKTALQGVTGGLSTAFETTLQALVAALLIQMILTFLKKSEQDFLDECSEYCATNIVNKLRIMPFDQQTN